VTALSIRGCCSGDNDGDGGGGGGKIWRKVSHANGGDLLRQLGVFGFHVVPVPQLLAGDAARPL
jgi:hypothetical protein